MDPYTSVSNYKNAPRTYPWTRQTEAVPQLRVTLPVCVRLTTLHRHLHMFFFHVQDIIQTSGTFTCRLCFCFSGCLCKHLLWPWWKHLCWLPAEQRLTRLLRRWISEGPVALLTGTLPLQRSLFGGIIGSHQ